jgi:PTS system beta-glucosides-specific IIC component
MRILALIADCFFYFLPFFLAVSAAHKFKTSEYLALALAGGLMYPTIIDAAKSIAAGNEVASISFLGMPIGFVNYSSTVIPIIIAVWLMSYVHRFLDHYIPSAVKTIFTPALVLIIMIPIELIAIGPAGSYLGTGLAEGVQWLFEKAGFVAGFAFAGARPLITMVGMHYGLMPISLQNLAEFGYDYLLPLSFVANMGQAAAAFAVFLKTKNKSFKVVAASTSFTALLGITEPAMYGVNLKLKKPFIAALIGAGIGGAFLTIFHVKAYGFVLPGITALPVFVGPEFIYLVIGALLTVAITMVLTFILGFEDVPENAKETGTPVSVQIASVPAASVPESAAHPISVPQGAIIEIASPLNGTVFPLKDVPDEAFSTEAMGKGVAVEPEDGRVYAPFDGIVETVFRTKHVVALKSPEGVEILIHVGIDTVKLQGKHFTVFIEEGQKVSAGELLMEFDLQEIRKEGFATIIPVIVTNSMDYTHVVVAEPAGSRVTIEKQLLTVIK